MRRKILRGLVRDDSIRNYITGTFAVFFMMAFFIFIIGGNLWSLYFLIPGLPLSVYTAFGIAATSRKAHSIKAIAHNSAYHRARAELAAAGKPQEDEGAAERSREKLLREIEARRNAVLERAGAIFKGVYDLHMLEKYLGSYERDMESARRCREEADKLYGLI